MPIAATIYYRGLRTLGVTAFSRRLQNAGLILCYHNVVSREEDRVGDPGLHVPRGQFERQVRWLASRYDVISLREFVARLAAGAALRSAAVITFDDGYAGVFEHAVPFLDSLGIPATIFVVAEAPGRSTGFWWDQPEIVETLTPAQYDRWLNHLHGAAAAILSEIRSVVSLPATHRAADWSTIRAHVGGGIDIGVHSATHRSLSTLTDADIQYEVVASRSIVHQATGVWPEFFAYPYGLCDRRVRGVVRKAGYQAALSVGGDLNNAGADWWGLRRGNVPAGISDAAVWALTAGCLPRWRR